jgi:putative MATE family efflux protein
LAGYVYNRRVLSLSFTMNKHLQATLIEGDVSRQLKIMAIPMVWGLMSTMSLNAIETFFIARLGREALAAFSFTFPIIMVLTSLGIGLGAGTSSAVARAIGEGDEMRARRLATDAMSLTFLLAVIVCILGWLTIEPLFLAMGASPELIPLIRSYMSIWYFSPPCLLVPMVGLAALRAMGMSHVQGYLMTAAGIFNLLLDPILIFGWGPIPSLGLPGAAIATLVTRTLILTTVIYTLHYKVGMLVNPFARWIALRSSWATVVVVGVPAMCANIVVPIASAIVFSMVSAYGTDAVAGLGIATRIEPLMLIVFYALSGIVGPFFGQNSGAGKLERLSEAITVLTRFSLLLGGGLAIFLGFGGAALAGLFSNHREVVLVAASYLAIIPISYGAYGIIMSVNAAFNGLGRPWPAMALSAARVLYVYLPLAWLGQWLWGLAGLFVATATSNLLIAAWAWWWVRRHIRQLSLAQHLHH